MTWLGHSKLRGHFEKLAYFLCTARLGSITEAAKALRLSQPALTVALKQLEAAIDAKLLTRGRHGIELTEVGRRLASEGEPLMLRLSDLANSLEQPSSSLSGTLRCCTHEILAGVVWPRILRDLSKAAPELELALETHRSTGEMVQLVKTMQQDVCIAAEVPAKLSLVSHPLFSARYGFFATKRFLKRLRSKSKAQLRLSAVSDFPVIFAPNVIAGAQRTLAECLENRGILLQSKFKVQTLETVITLASSDLGLALIPELYAQSAAYPVFEELRFKELEKEPLGMHQYYLCCRESLSKDPRIDLIRQACQNFQTQ